MGDTPSLERMTQQQLLLKHSGASEQHVIHWPDVYHGLRYHLWLVNRVHIGHGLPPMKGTWNYGGHAVLGENATIFAIYQEHDTVHSRLQHRCGPTVTVQVVVSQKNRVIFLSTPQRSTETCAVRGRDCA